MPVTGMKILIVDDNLAVREMIRSFLPEAFDQVCECADGADALACYRSFRPDWVLMDWDMKGLNGLAATREILVEFPEARIVFVTQHEDPELRIAADEAGAKGFVLKDDLSALRSLLFVQ